MDKPKQQPDIPAVWPFPTYKGQPYKQPKTVKPVKAPIPDAPF